MNAYGQGGFGAAFQPRLTPAVKGLLIAIAVGFVLQLSLENFLGVSATYWLGFSPEAFFSGRLWQILTYPFLHGGMGHLMLNALVLYTMGSELERRWGTKRFLWFYGLCAVGGAILHSIVWLALSLFGYGGAAELGGIPVIGASGSLYGLMVGFGMLFGEAVILVFFIAPMKAKHFTALMAAMTFLSAVFYGDPKTGGGVAHLVHLGGLVTGYLLLKFFGKDLGGFGGGPFGRRRPMDRDELKRRLSVVVNNDERSGSGKYPVTWN